MAETDSSSRRSFLATAMAGLAVASLPRWAFARGRAPAWDWLELANGVRVLLLPIEGVDVVATEAVYPVGFMHEPRGRPQLAHFVEHLVCNCPTASFDALESMAELNRIGMANAETLATFTHYDIGVPADQFELAVRVEAERLSSLRLAEEIRQREAPRCYQEIDFVANQSAFVPSKWAAVAANQFWRYGATDVRLREGLAESPLEELRAFMGRYYRPEKLMLVVAGGFDRERVIDILRAHLGTVEAAEDPTEISSIDWEGVARDASVQWDMPQRVVIVSYPPADDPDERIAATAVLSGAGMSLRGRTWMSAALPATSSRLTPVCDAPAMLMFMPPEGVDPLDAGSRAGEALEQLMAGSSLMGKSVLRSSAFHAPSAAQVDQAEKRLAQLRGMAPERALMMIASQAALDAGVAVHWLGGDPDARIANLAARDDAWWRRAVSSINAQRRIVTVLEPA